VWNPRNRRSVFLGTLSMSSDNLIVTKKRPALGRPLDAENLANNFQSQQTDVGVQRPPPPA
jgi:hypothetical protein